jgi:hypothetical protein
MTKEEDVNSSRFISGERAAVYFQTAIGLGLAVFSVGQIVYALWRWHQSQF